MIDWQTFCQIRQLRDEAKLTIAQIAAQLALHWKTVAAWEKRPRYARRQSVPARRRVSKLEAFKPAIQRLPATHPYSAAQLFTRLQAQGYPGRYSILKTYVRTVRPLRTAAFLTLHFAPGQCAQVDWGSWGSIRVGNTRRRLSFFALAPVLAHSRQLHLEFTLGQSQEQWLACHEHAFEYLGGIPAEIMADNCKTAVLARPAGAAPVFNPTCLGFARHYGFTIKACAPRRPQQKGRVENGVGYIKKNFLAGLELAGFAALNPAARVWLDTVANVRLHRETQRRPVDLFREAEQPKLRAMPLCVYAAALVRPVRATHRCRVVVETNRYSVPPAQAGQLLTLKLSAEKLRLYAGEQLVAEHPRSHEKHQDVEHPDHVQMLLHERSEARHQRLLLAFLALSAHAPAYHEQPAERRLNLRHHVQKIVALAEIYGTAAIGRALARCARPRRLQLRVSRQPRRAAPAPDPGARCPASNPRERSARTRTAPARSLTRSPAARAPHTMNPGLHEHLTYLKLTAIAAQCEALATAAAAKGWTHVDYLRRLLEGQCRARQQRAIERRVRDARFPVIKTLDAFRWDWPKKLNELQVKNLLRLSFVAKMTNVILMGGGGLGKSHSAAALGYEACQRGHAVLFTTAVDALNNLVAAQAAQRLKAELKRYLTPAVLVLDELGYLPLDKTGADLLFQVISQRYERGSLIITTNKACKNWAEIFNHDAGITSAILDRVLPHAETVVIEGKSFRMKDQIESPA